MRRNVISHIVRVCHASAYMIMRGQSPGENFNCKAELEREGAAEDRLERTLIRINDGEETRRRMIREIVEPAECERDRITQKLENL